MKTTEEIMRREWQTHKPFRAINAEGTEVYFLHKPDAVIHLGVWRPKGTGWVYTGNIDQSWSRKNWRNSLQSVEEYLKLINNENDNSN
jgi:hypothetical protein